MHFVQRTGTRGGEKEEVSVSEKREFYFLF